MDKSKYKINILINCAGIFINSPIDKMSSKIIETQSTIDDFGSALRPMIVYFAILDQLSSDFAPNYDDEKIEESADHMVEVIEACHKSKNIHELLQKAKINLPQDQIINELQRGMMSA